MCKEPVAIGQGGNVRRPWRSANHADRWRREADRRATVGTTDGDGRRMRKGNLVSGGEHVVADASGSASKGAASVVSDGCETYYP